MSRTKTVKYEYDKLDRLSKKVYHNSISESYEYDTEM
jgi:YD repeat-containing protein